MTVTVPDGILLKEYFFKMTKNWQILSPNIDLKRQKYQTEKQTVYRILNKNRIYFIS